MRLATFDLCSELQYPVLYSVALNSKQIICVLKFIFMVSPLTVVRRRDELSMYTTHC